MAKWTSTVLTCEAYIFSFRNACGAPRGGIKNCYSSSCDIAFVVRFCADSFSFSLCSWKELRCYIVRCHQLIRLLSNLDEGLSEKARSTIHPPTMKERIPVSAAYFLVICYAFQPVSLLFYFASAFLPFDVAELNH